MKNRIIFICLFIMIGFTLQAQNEKLRVAVFDPTSSGTGIDEGTKMAVREIISSTLVNTGKYTIVERSLVEKVMQEQKFSNSGAVDDSQASEIGKLISANKIVLSVVTLAGGRNMLSVKLVDVNTASVEKQKTQVVDANKLLDFVEPMTLELMGENATGIQQKQTTRAAKNPAPVSSIAVQSERQTPTPKNTESIDAQDWSMYPYGMGSVKPKVVWGVRAEINYPVGYGHIPVNGKIGIEIGPVLYYSLTNSFYINTGIMFGIQRFEVMREFEENNFNISIPIYLGYHFTGNSRVSYFAQAGAFANYNNVSSFPPLAPGLAIIAGINIQRYKIAAGYQIGLKDYFFGLKLHALSLGVSYVF